MAVTLAQTLDTPNVKVATVIATADADTTQTLLWVTAGTDFDVTPLTCIILPILAAGGLSAWAVTVLTTTTLTVVKTTAVGSGNAGIQATFTVLLRRALVGRLAGTGVTMTPAVIQQPSGLPFIPSA